MKTLENIENVNNLNSIEKLESIGFDGIDADIETSLFEYGIAWIETDDGILFIYGIGHDGEVYNKFDRMTFDKGVDLFEEYDWVEWEPVFSFIGMDRESWQQMPLGHKVYDLTSYYGNDNIFGQSYWEGFEIA